MSWTQETWMTSSPVTTRYKWRYQCNTQKNLLEIPTEGPPCISAPYTIPLKFRPWADNTINKLLEASMIQHTISTWAPPIIILPKKGLEIPKYPKILLPVDARLRLARDFCKLNQKLPAESLSYDKEGQRIVKQGINAPYPLPGIDEMLASIRGCNFLTTLDCTGAFHGLMLSPDAAMKSAFITHLWKFQWIIAPFGLVLLPSYYSKAMQETLCGLEEFTRNCMDDILLASYTENKHLHHIRQVFKHFCKFKMKLKLAKCEFGRSEIQFLGHIISHEAIRTQENRENIEDQSTKKCWWSTSISWSIELILQVYTSICRLDASHPETPEKECKIWMDWRMWQSIQNSKGNTHKRSHTIPPRPKQILDDRNRCQ